jgi:hypothetical protein
MAGAKYKAICLKPRLKTKQTAPSSSRPMANKFTARRVKPTRLGHERRDRQWSLNSAHLA